MVFDRSAKYRRFFDPADHGAAPALPPADMFWGDRYGWLSEISNANARTNRLEKLLRVGRREETLKYLRDDAAIRRYRDRVQQDRTLIGITASREYLRSFPGIPQRGLERDHLRRRIEVTNNHDLAARSGSRPR